MTHQTKQRCSFLFAHLGGTHWLHTLVALLLYRMQIPSAAMTSSSAGCSICGHAHKALREAISHHRSYGPLERAKELLPSACGSSKRSLHRSTALPTSSAAAFPVLREVSSNARARDTALSAVVPDAYVHGPTALLEIAPHEGLQALRRSPPLLDGLEDFDPQ